jgi:hypothetical protein
MSKKDFAQYKKKYQAFRHHAWAGLGFLSVSLAIRLIFPESTVMLTPVIVILAIYILIALIFTYRYREGLNASHEAKVVSPSIELEKEKLKTDIEKEKLKLQKKKAKSEIKKQKKAKK